jgi:hypothetical protein
LLNTAAMVLRVPEEHATFGYDCQASGQMCTRL